MSDPTYSQGSTFIVRDSRNGGRGFCFHLDFIVADRCALRGVVGVKACSSKLCASLTLPSWRRRSTFQERSNSRLKLTSRPFAAPALRALRSDTGRRHASCSSLPLIISLVAATGVPRPPLVRVAGLQLSHMTLGRRARYAQ